MIAHLYPRSVASPPGALRATLALLERIGGNTPQPAALDLLQRELTANPELRDALDNLPARQPVAHVERNLYTDET